MDKAAAEAAVKSVDEYFDDKIFSSDEDDLGLDDEEIVQGIPIEDTVFKRPPRELVEGAKFKGKRWMNTRVHFEGAEFDQYLIQWPGNEVPGRSMKDVQMEHVMYARPIKDGKLMNDDCVVAAVVFEGDEKPTMIKSEDFKTVFFHALKAVRQAIRTKSELTDIPLSGYITVIFEKQAHNIALVLPIYWKNLLNIYNQRRAKWIEEEKKQDEAEKENEKEEKDNEKKEEEVEDKKKKDNKKEKKEEDKKEEKKKNEEKGKKSQRDYQKSAASVAEVWKGNKDDYDSEEDDDDYMDEDEDENEDEDEEQEDEENEDEEDEEEDEIDIDDAPPSPVRQKWVPHISKKDKAFASTYEIPESRGINSEPKRKPKPKAKPKSKTKKQEEGETKTKKMSKTKKQEEEEEDEDEEDEPKTKKMSKTKRKAEEEPKTKKKSKHKEDDSEAEEEPKTKKKAKPKAKAKPKPTRKRKLEIEDEDDDVEIEPDRPIQKDDDDEERQGFNKEKQKRNAQILKYGRARVLECMKRRDGKLLPDIFKDVDIESIKDPKTEEEKLLKMKLDIVLCYLCHYPPPSNSLNIAPKPKTTNPEPPPKKQKHALDVGLDF